MIRALTFVMRVYYEKNRHLYSKNNIKQVVEIYLFMPFLQHTLKDIVISIYIYTYIYVIARPSNCVDLRADVPLYDALPLLDWYLMTVFLVVFFSLSLLESLPKSNRCANALLLRQRCLFAVSEP